MRTYQLIATALLAALAAILQFYNGIVGIPTGFGMTIDLAAVPILLAFFIFGYESAFYAAIILALVITFSAPTGYIGAVTKFVATLPMFLIPAIYLMSLKRKFDAGKVFALIFFSSLIIIAIFALSTFAALLGDYFSEEPLYVGLFPIAIVLISSVFFVMLAKKYEEPASKLSKPHLALIVLLLAVIVRGVVMVITNLFFAGPIFFKLSATEFIAFVESYSYLPFLGKSFWYVIIFFWNVLQGMLEFSLAWYIAFRLKFFERYSEPKG